jgi:hypothetical protein
MEDRAVLGLDNLEAIFDAVDVDRRYLFAIRHPQTDFASLTAIRAAEGFGPMIVHTS